MIWNLTGFSLSRFVQATCCIFVSPGGIPPSPPPPDAAPPAIEAPSLDAISAADATVELGRSSVEALLSRFHCPHKRNHATDQPISVYRHRQKSTSGCKLWAEMLTFICSILERPSGIVGALAAACGCVFCCDSSAEGCVVTDVVTPFSRFHCPHKTKPRKRISVYPHWQKSTSGCKLWAEMLTFICSTLDRPGGGSGDGFAKGCVVTDVATLFCRFHCPHK